MTDHAVYEPNYRARTNSIRIWSHCLKTVYRRKDLLFYLVRRDFLSDFKRSFISAGWILMMRSSTAKLPITLPMIIAVRIVDGDPTGQAQLADAGPPPDLRQ